MKFRASGITRRSDPQNQISVVVSLKRDHYVTESGYWVELHVFADSDEDGEPDIVNEIPDPGFDKKFEIPSTDSRFDIVTARRMGGGNLHAGIRIFAKNQVSAIFPSATFTDLDTDTV